MVAHGSTPRLRLEGDATNADFSTAVNLAGATMPGPFFSQLHVLWLPPHRKISHVGFNLNGQDIRDDATNPYTITQGNVQLPTASLQATGNVLIATVYWQNGATPTVFKAIFAFSDLPAFPALVGTPSIVQNGLQPSWNWTTNVGTTGLVKYGKTADALVFSPTPSNVIATAHSLTDDLTTHFSPGDTVFYQVGGMDSAGHSFTDPTVRSFTLPSATPTNPPTVLNAGASAIGTAAVFNETLDIPGQMFIDWGLTSALGSTASSLTATSLNPTVTVSPFTPGDTVFWRAYAKGPTGLVSTKTAIQTLNIPTGGGGTTTLGPFFRMAGSPTRGEIQTVDLADGLMTASDVATVVENSRIGWLQLKASAPGAVEVVGQMNPQLQNRLILTGLKCDATTLFGATAKAAHNVVDKFVMHYCELTQPFATASNFGGPGSIAAYCAAGSLVVLSACDIHDSSSDTIRCEGGDLRLYGCQQWRARRGDPKKLDHVDGLQTTSGSITIVRSLFGVPRDGTTNWWDYQTYDPNINSSGDPPSSTTEEGQGNIQIQADSGNVTIHLDRVSVTSAGGRISILIAAIDSTISGGPHSLSGTATGLRAYAKSWTALTTGTKHMSGTTTSYLANPAFQLLTPVNTAAPTVGEQSDPDNFRAQYSYDDVNTFLSDISLLTA